jgi:TM2 domain-containing membrane protein YozV
MLWLTAAREPRSRYHRDTEGATWESDKMSEGQGSGGNVLAAICSFFIPGLGQLVQGRLLMAIVMFVLAGLLWIVLLGWLVHLWSIIDAALFKPGR